MADVDNILKNIDDFFKSDKGKEFKEHQKHLQKLSVRNNKYLRSLTVEQRSALIEKIVQKYESDDYQLREYRKGFEPRTPLYSILLNYAAAYCRPSLYKVNEYFEEQQWDIDGKWIISIIYGQGSFIKLTKLKEGEIVPHCNIEENIDVEIYDPTDELIIKTNDTYVIKDILNQIGDKKGYYTIKEGIKKEINATNKNIKVPNKIKWRGSVFTYERCKQNILIYKIDGGYYFEDWVDDPEILVVQLRKDKVPDEAFYVLFYMRGTRNYDIIVENITSINRMATPIYE